MKPFLFVTIKVLDKNGRRTSCRSFPAKSLLKNFIIFMYGQLAANWATQAKDYSNTARTLTAAYTYLLNAAAANAWFGILVGSGITAVSPNDYYLATAIGHGSGAGQLYYQAMLFGALTVSGQDSYFTIQRNFNNNSGADITVKEIVLICNTTTGPYYIQLARDLTGDVVVQNGKTLVVTYTFLVSA